jgi:hypothetical protein
MAIALWVRPGTPRDAPAACTRSFLQFDHTILPLNGASSSAGAFSLGSTGVVTLAVGGDYAKPTETSGTAAYFDPYFGGWFAAKSNPTGYRSSVAYDAATDTWITVGPNGTDVSTDDGRNWRALRPNAALNEAADADQHWNALSLPFVVGPHGRIGKLNPNALAP